MTPAMEQRPCRAAMVTAVIILAVVACATAFAQRISVSSAEQALEKGENAFEEGRYRKAVKHFTEALRINPHLHCARYLRGKSYYHLGEYLKAQDDLQTYEKKTREVRKPRACRRARRRRRTVSAKDFKRLRRLDAVRRTTKTGGCLLRLRGLVEFSD